MMRNLLLKHTQEKTFFLLSLSLFLCSSPGEGRSLDQRGMGLDENLPETNRNMRSRVITAADFSQNFISDLPDNMYCTQSKITEMNFTTNQISVIRANTFVW